ncbi:MAG: hypothetical protein KME07_05425 [Pegethrix bostrychoides GSE-TBD4-15B]|jgi:hypothetical protein|uniref:Uncharacterized protein n=1 Tax=Pegethrix bostrychoides GSE-TBD4-15B TaxID=2839662 RepID=A0A951U3P0_9CYAN|nr:hypothetical protein [Pegethrix bostrychoides GSE-TBD4-15B]
MLATRLYQTLTAPPNRRQIQLWLGLSLLVSLLYSLPALQEAFKGEFVIQDDARQHVFWMRRFIDPALFPNDLIADYFQSVAPWGYSTLYWLFAQLGVDPVALSKLLPTLLGLIATGFCFGVGMQVLPLPIAGFATATLLNHNLWMRDDLVSATPGAFLYPIFLGFLYFLLRNSLIPCVITIALQGLFYPQSVFLSAGILLLRLRGWQFARSRISGRWAETRQMRLIAAGLGMAALVIGLYSLKSSEFGQAISLDTARAMPAFAPLGWSAFFSDSFVGFWICGKRSGMVPTEWCDLSKNAQEVFQPWLLLRFASIWLGLGLLLALRLPLAQRLTANLSILPQILITSISMFLLAHLLAFRLHLPNRYTEHSLRILLALAAGITLVILWERLFQFCLKLNQSHLPVAATIILAAALIFYPYSLLIDGDPFPVTGYFRGRQTALYEFLAKQPPETTVASLSEEANQIPSFAQRALYAGGEGFLLPYHPRYYEQMSQRLLAVIEAQYSPDLDSLKAFIRQSQVGFWLLDNESFQPDFANPKSYLKSVFDQFPAETAVIKTQIQAGLPSALSEVSGCIAWKNQQFRLLRAKCILRQ